MSMYIVNIAVRWQNGELEGFGSSALTETAARTRAILKAQRKALDLDLPLPKELTKADYDALSAEDQEEIQKHWNSQSL